MTDRSLSECMTEAANTLVAASTRAGLLTEAQQDAEHIGWTPKELRHFAEVFKQEDGEVEEIRRELAQAIMGFTGSDGALAGRIMERFNVERRT